MVANLKRTSYPYGVMLPRCGQVDQVATVGGPDAGAEIPDQEPSFASNASVFTLSPTVASFESGR